MALDVITSPTSTLDEGRYPGHGYRRVEEPDLIRECDVPVKLRDGTTMFVDLFRPKASEPACPALIAWSPYGKHGFKHLGMMPGADVDPAWITKHTIWEGPDPGFWCPEGYVVVSPDPRGSWSSEGTLTFFSSQEARDGYDLIEWIAEQPWSNGKVGMLGVSYLAISQWSIAATQPPHLAAICPWEGLSDPYREAGFHGGIPEKGFLSRFNKVSRFSQRPAEDFLTNPEAHPLLDDYWADKAADLAAITVPAFVVASWGDQGMHTRGTLEGFKRISSAQKWLEIHGQKKWRHFFHPESVARQKQFFDHFLTGADSGVLDWPPVKIEVRASNAPGTIRNELHWPLDATEYRPIFLDATGGRMTAGLPAVRAACTYDPAQTESRVTFDHVFHEPTELTGHMKLKVWLSTSEGSDIDVFVAAQKLDGRGNVVGFNFFSTFAEGPAALGWLRVSHREADPDRSTIFQPWLLHRREVPVEPGQIVSAEIELWPSSTQFNAGESLRIVVGGSDLYRFNTGEPELRHPTINRGEHTIHTGGIYDSHLIVPFIRSAKT